MDTTTKFIAILTMFSVFFLLLRKIIVSLHRRFMIVSLFFAGQKSNARSTTSRLFLMPEDNSQRRLIIFPKRKQPDEGDAIWIDKLGECQPPSSFPGGSRRQSY
jgi:hypothetical protein